jgi:hypothetical protein
MRRVGVAVLIAAGVGIGTAAGHHGAADYHVDREIVVEGVVREWRWTNPHTRITLEVPGADGRMERWSGEGPPLSWAAQRGWSARTLHTGERVSMVMYPGRSTARSGLVKRIRRASGEELIVSRPWLD